MSKDNRIGHLHHGSFHVQGKEHPFLLGTGHLLVQEFHQGSFAHHCAINDFSFQQRKRFLQELYRTILCNKLDARSGFIFDGNRLLIGTKIVFPHCRHIGLGIRTPCTHRMGM